MSSEIQIRMITGKPWVRQFNDTSSLKIDTTICKNFSSFLPGDSRSRESPKRGEYCSAGNASELNVKNSISYLRSIPSKLIKT